jgi:hypothetical protein
MFHQALEDEYRLLKRDHRQTLVQRAARLILAGSVIRVFVPETDHDIWPVLALLKVDELPAFDGQEQFRQWFKRALDRVATAIQIRNSDNSRIHPGYKWGHGTKVLTLFLRELVMSSRYFTDEEAGRIGEWLYTPLDRIALNRLQQLGHPNGIHAIKDIATARDFYSIQDDLGEAAAKVGVPRIWFDDVWTRDENH